MERSVLAGKLKACFARHPEILAVYAFGSTVKGRMRRTPQDLDLSSDLDLGVLLDFSVPEDRRWDWWERLHGEMSSCVKEELDLIIMNGAPLGLVHEILRTGKRIYEKSGRRYRREEAQLLIEALDFMPVKELIENRAIERIKASHG